MRYYSSNARETSLTAAVTASTTTLVVDNPVGWPASVPFEAHIELGTTNEEICLVTAVSGNNWTVTRGFDGSSALPHSAGAKVVHGVSAIDFREPQEHIAAATNVHGLTGGAAVVGTSSSQSLSNKTLVTPAISDFTAAQHNHSSPATGGPTGSSCIRVRQTTGFTGIGDINYQVADYNFGFNWSSTVNPDRIYPQQAGVYAISLTADQNGAGDLSGYCALQMWYEPPGGGTIKIAENVRYKPSNLDHTTRPVYTEYLLQSGSYVYGVSYVENGAIGTGDGVLTAHLIRPA